MTHGARLIEMKAIRVHEFGDSTKLIYEDVPLPEPGAGEVRVKVEAAGVNFIDIYDRRGWYENPLPMTAGREFCGTVDAAGDGVRDFQPGERIATASGRGAYAEYAIVHAEKAIKVPKEITSQKAAAILLQGITAHYLTTSTYTVKRGDTVLIHAGAGGVGNLLVQIAKMSRARVIATASSEEKKAIAKEAGADEVINYSQEDFAEAVKRLTEGKGVDVVYDGVGEKTFLNGLDCLKPRAIMVLYGQASGKVEPLDPQVLNRKGSLYLTRPSIGHYLQNRSEFQWRAGELFAWMIAGSLNVRIDKTFPLEYAAQAQQYMEERKTKGKVLLIP